MKKNTHHNDEVILYNIISHMPDYVLWKDLDSVYKGCNLNTAKLFGFESIDQIVGKTDHEICPKSASKMIEYDNDVIKTGKEYKIDFKIELAHKNQIITLKAQIKPLKVDSEIVGILLIAKATESMEEYERQIKELMQEQEHTYRILEKAVTEITGQNFPERLPIRHYVDELSNCFKNIILQMPCYVYWKDLNFRYTYCNELTAEILGFKTVEEVIGKTDYDFGWDPKLVDEYRRIDVEIIQTGEPKLGFEEKLFKDNKEYNLLVNKMPLFNKNGGVIGIIGITVDITDRKEAEKLKLETQAQQVTIDAQQNIKKFIDTIQNAIQVYRFNSVNRKSNVNNRILANIPPNIKLTKRENEILFYMSLNKSPKEISTILSSSGNKPVSANTIQSIINKQLYPKFNVHNASHLLEAAFALGLIETILE